MTALRRLVASIAVLVGVCSAALVAQAPVSQTVAQSRVEAVMSAAGVAPGGIKGVVLDDRGAPLDGAMVSALGLTTAFAVTDRQGRFALGALPAGSYMLRAHLGGYSPARARIIQVSPERPAISTIALRRIASRNAALAPDEIPVLAAGMSSEQIALEPLDPESAIEDDDHDHSETAWRLRHITRSVLKDTGASPVGADADSEADDTMSEFPWRAVRTANAAARMAANVLADLPLSGQFNLLTTGTLDAPEQLFSSDNASHSVAYLSIGAPAGRGDWAIQGAMTQGDLASWVLSGSYITRAPARHAYELGMSYSMQRYDGGNPAALAAVTDGTRNAGDVYGFDRWSVSRYVTLAYGARYSSYDYLERGPLFSPRVGVTLTPFHRLRIDTLVSRRMLAPGAEEFTPPASGGVWLPPERTFSPLVAGDVFRPERTDHYQVQVQHDIAANAFIGVRTFYQSVNDQLVTVFDIPSDAAADVGHYYVGNVGSFDARGWGASVGHTVANRLRGVVDYTVTTANWQPSPERERLSLAAPGAAHRDRERLHDVTTSLQADIPETATRVFVLYRINNGFARDDVDGEVGGRSPRFDLQVNQALPFLNMLATEWEMLVAVRNVFREGALEASVYDELLVVRPPKRIVGGLTVRF